jgi:HAD-superfamily hydrolase, subfamily IIB
MRNKFENFIIVSDIDGTFIDDQSKMVDRNLEAIKYFKQNGGQFTFATGRIYGSLHAVVPNAKDLCNLPAIMCNGSYRMDLKSREKFDEVFLDYEKSIKLFYAIKENIPDVGVRIIINERYATPFLTPEIAWEMEHFHWAGYMVMPFEEMPKLWNKAVYVAKNEKLQQVREFLDRNLDEAFITCFSDSTLLEIQPANGTKGTKLSAIKQQSKNEAVKIFAIGDHENDINMLQAADYPVTPKNGIAKLKEIPNIIHVCSNNEGAIAGLVEEIDKNLNLYQV